MLKRQVFDRRIASDNSQRVRRGIQFLFFLLNVYLGVLFYRFVVQFETFRPEHGIARPVGIEAGCLSLA